MGTYLSRGSMTPVVLEVFQGLVPWTPDELPLWGSIQGLTGASAQWDKIVLPCAPPPRPPERDTAAHAPCDWRMGGGGWAALTRPRAQPGENPRPPPTFSHTLAEIASPCPRVGDTHKPYLPIPRGLTLPEHFLQRGHRTTLNGCPVVMQTSMLHGNGNSASPPMQSACTFPQQVPAHARAQHTVGTAVSRFQRLPESHAEQDRAKRSALFPRQAKSVNRICSETHSNDRKKDQKNGRNIGLTTPYFAWEKRHPDMRVETQGLVSRLMTRFFSCRHHDPCIRKSHKIRPMLLFFWGGGGQPETTHTCAISW